MARLFLLLSAFAGFTGVALGAFAAHGLKSRLSPEHLAVFRALFGWNTASSRTDERPSASRKPPSVKSGTAASSGETARR